MTRKWMTLAVVTAVTLAAGGLSMAADEDSPLHKLMEKVNSKNNAIKKATRTAPAYKKAQQNSDIVKDVDELIALGKQAGEMKSAAEKEKRPFAEWVKLNNDFVKETEKFKELVSKPATSQEQAKRAYVQVGASCTACHNVFRKEDDN